MVRTSYFCGLDQSYNLPIFIQIQSLKYPLPQKENKKNDGKGFIVT
jgi:hypothetical protein